MNRIRGLLLLLQCGCLIGGGLLMAKPAYRWGRRTLGHLQAKSTWRDIQSSDRVGTEPGSPALWLDIPDRGIHDLVLHQNTLETLNRHPCLAPGSPSVILGHRDTHFRNLQHLRIQDTIELEKPNGTRERYRVTEIEILPSEKASARISEHRNPTSLILLTCYPFQYLGHAPERFIVWATRI